eukprot:1785948-Prorocentrum_lima.AAC.1
MLSDAGDISLEDLREGNVCSVVARLLLLECALPAAHVLISKQDTFMAQRKRKRQVRTIAP